MREYCLEDYVIEQKGTENVSYILKQNDIFFPTGYKVLQGKESRGMAKCGKLLHNGKIKLVYFTSGYISLQAAASYLDIVGIRTVLKNLVSNILAVRENGFLKCENIAVSPDKIFVDRDTLEVYLVYLPIQVLENEYDRNAFENELRTQLIKLLNSMVNLNGAQIKTILFELSNGSASLEYLYQFLKKEDMSAGDLSHGGESPAGYGQYGADWLLLESVDGRYVFKISQEEFAIGKNSATVDGVIRDNPAVSRTHCKIMKTAGRFWLEDLGSSNGTYLNGCRLEPQKKAAICKGDQIRIANMEFTAG